MKKNNKQDVVIDVYLDRQGSNYDPDGSWTGVPKDKNDKPITVPRLILQTEDEKLAWQHGEERRRIRIQRKKDKLDGI